MRATSKKRHETATTSASQEIGLAANQEAAATSPYSQTFSTSVTVMSCGWISK
jgi:hypothetical protein